MIALVKLVGTRWVWEATRGAWGVVHKIRLLYHTTTTTTTTNTDTTAVSVDTVSAAISTSTGSSMSRAFAVAVAWGRRWKAPVVVAMAVNAVVAASSAPLPSCER